MDEIERQLALALFRLRSFEASLLARHPPTGSLPTDAELADHLTLCDEVQRLSIKREKRRGSVVPDDDPQPWDHDSDNVRSIDDQEE